MKITRYLLVALLLPASIFSAVAVPAHQCIEFSQIPIRITKAGCYLLTADISVSDQHTDAITIETNNVEINLNGHQIRNLSNPETRTNGIYANSIRNLSIKNGHIFGYFYAIRIDGSSDGRLSKNIYVSDIVASNNYFRGLSIEAVNAKIEGTRVDSTGGTTVFPDAFAIAIEVKGDSCVVRNNIVGDVDATGIGEGIGISLSSSRKNCDINSNTIKSSSLENSTFGIWLSGENFATTVRNNNIEGFIYPFSVPRLRGKKYPAQITATFYRNKMSNTLCNPFNFKSYFLNLPKSNEFIGNHESCPILISEILKKNYDLEMNAAANFRLATAMYHCDDEPLLSRSSCCEMQGGSVKYFEKASYLGLEEAKRVLPGVTNAVKNSSQCK